MIAAEAQTAVTFALSPGEAHDAPQGRQLLLELRRTRLPLAILMDHAYEGEEALNLVLDLGYEPVVPPKQIRLKPWEYDRELYKRRNEVERLFRRMKDFRRIFSRFEKLDIVFLGFIHFVMTGEALRELC